jgi:hypothetical protein
MGMRSGDGAVSGRPALLWLGVAAVALEAAGLCVAVVANIIDDVAGRTSTPSNAAGFIVLELIIAAGVAWIASGVARVRPWSRTPAVMTQVFTALIAFWLLQAHRFDWGVPALLLAVAGLAGLLAPASFRALARPPFSSGGTPPGSPRSASRATPPGSPRSASRATPPGSPRSSAARTPAGNPRARVNRRS